MLIAKVDSKEGRQTVKTVPLQKDSSSTYRVAMQSGDSGEAQGKGCFGVRWFLNCVFTREYVPVFVCLLVPCCFLETCLSLNLELMVFC